MHLPPSFLPSELERFVAEDVPGDDEEDFYHGVPGPEGADNGDLGDVVGLGFGAPGGEDLFGEVVGEVLVYDD